MFNVRKSFLKKLAILKIIIGTDVINGSQSGISVYRVVIQVVHFMHW